MAARGLSPELVKVATATAGQGTVTLGAAVTGFMGMGQLVDGKQYVYTINDGNDREVGIGVFTDSNDTLTRATVIRAMISGTEGTTKLTLSGSATVQIGSSGYDHASTYNLSYGGITGLAPVWTDATHVGCTPGTAYIESIDRTIFAAPADVAISLGNSKQCHVFLKTDGTIEAVDNAAHTVEAFTVPIGTARRKLTISGSVSDPTRRYLYSFFTDGSGNVRQFDFHPSAGVVQWVGNLGAAPFAVLTSGVATMAAPLDCSACVPVTARSVRIAATNLAGTPNLCVTSADLTPSATNWNILVSNGGLQDAVVPCSSAQAIKYVLTGAPSADAAYIQVLGFGLLR